MSDEPNDSRLLRISNRAPGQVIKIGLGAAQRMQTAVQGRLDQVLDASLARISKELEDPQNVMRLQEQLAKVAGWSIELGFRLDPAAKDLFDFVLWIEESRGREEVQDIVMAENLMADGQLLEFLIRYATMLKPIVPIPGAPDGDAPAYTLEEVERFKTEAGRRLLRLLVRLAALTDPSTTNPPLDDVEAMADYFEDAPIPERFKDLASRALGTYEEPTSEPRSTAAPSRIRKRIDKLKAMTRSITEESSTGLARYVPGLNDPTLKFIVFSYTFFLQTFMVRALIENFPDLMAAARESNRDF